jgi:L-asparaginase
MNKRKVLIIYTGGTIGMVRNHFSGGLVAFDFDHLFEQIPELRRLDVELTSISFEKPIDSSEIHPVVWSALASLIQENYDLYDGFVVLHGSDTMAFTASALSFMLQGLKKPIVFTGSQLPIGTIRTDGKENFITAVEIAAMQNENGESIVQEVAIYFEYSLYRGNRTSKVSASEFEAFKSGNFPELARAGVEIKFDEHALYRSSLNELQFFPEFDSRLAHVSLFPGINFEFYESLFDINRVKGIVLSTFGSGNGPNDPKMIEMLADFIQKGGHVLNITQCWSGAVQQGKYDASKQFLNIGVLGGGALTTEAAITKMMHLLGKGVEGQQFIKEISQNLCGEM